MEALCLCALVRAVSFQGPCVSIDIIEAMCQALGREPSQFDIVEHLDGTAFHQGRVTPITQDDARVIVCNQSNLPLQSRDHVIQVCPKYCAMAGRSERNT
eukprot:538836-Amphidinium_carterae.1